MKKFSIFMLSFFIASLSYAKDVMIENRTYGSGVLGDSNSQIAQPHDGLVLWVPQHLPGYPTAATLWPRVVEIPCKNVGHKLVCDGYQNRPEYGRGEYLFILPKVAEPPTVVEKVIPIPSCVTCKTQEPIIIYKEVPSKKIGG